MPLQDLEHLSHDTKKIGTIRSRLNHSLDRVIRLADKWLSGHTAERGDASPLASAQRPGPAGSSPLARAARESAQADKEYEQSLDSGWSGAEATLVSGGNFGQTAGEGEATDHAGGEPVSRSGGAQERAPTQHMLIRTHDPCAPYVLCASVK
jgi:hypothetical protein